MILIVSALATALFTLARGIALLRIESRMGAAVQAGVWDRLLGVPLQFFRPYTAGDLATRAMSIDAMRQLFSGVTVTAIMGGIFSLGNFGLMFYYSAAMAWRATLLIGLAMIVTAVGSYLQLSHQRSVYFMQAKTEGLVLQLLSGIAKLRVAGAEIQAFALWARRFGAQRQRQYKIRRIANWVQAFNAAFPVAAYILIFWCALPLIAQSHTMRTGDFMAFLSAYASCSGALLSTCIALLNTLNVVPLYEQAKPILQTPPEVTAGRADPGLLAGQIEVQHAVFRYQSDGPAVLRDVTFEVRPGEFVALVGPSGSGKSTVLRLLLGFESLESGSVYFDGQELSGLDVQAVRRQIGVVLQSGRLMSGDIFTNIVGSSLVTLEDAWEAARMAGFADDVQAMPMGMHTVISEGGGTLSGGQRQRLMIARALVHRPRILFFDEATSALDNRTQAIVSQSLERLQATRIVVAHRLSTIANADRIVVLERGRVVEMGNYAHLMAQRGLFADLARRQIG
jgi:ATP-binding cassette subfamily C protein